MRPPEDSFNIKCHLTSVGIPIKRLRWSQNVHPYAWKAFILKQGLESQITNILKLISIRHRSDTYLSNRY